MCVCGETKSLILKAKVSTVSSSIQKQKRKETVLCCAVFPYSSKMEMDSILFSNNFIHKNGNMNPYPTTSKVEIKNPKKIRATI